MPLPKTKSQLEIEKLWRFEGREDAFWIELLRVFSAQIEAASGMILVEVKDESGATQWTPVAVWPEAEETRHRLASHREALFSLAADAAGKESGFLVDVVEEGIRGAVLPLRSEDDSVRCVAAFIRYGLEDFFRPGERIERLMIDTPLIYGANPFAGQQAREKDADVSREPLAIALAMGLLLNEEKRFLAAAMVLCNELAARFGADRVSLGWQRGSYVRLRATNHAEKINRKMEMSRFLEAAMEECLDQDDEIRWPGAAAAIERDHERYARKFGIENVVSVPFRDGSKPVGVITLERVEEFTETDLDALRLAADLGTRRLGELQDRDRWFGARLGSALKRGLAKVVGFEHTWWKVGALATTGLIAFLAFYPWPFRVEAAFILQPQQIHHIPAPFDGYIEEVLVEAGDAVAKGAPLVRMDTSELILSRAELAASLQRFIAEAQLARIEATPAEMHIAVSQAEEIKASLKKVQYSLEMAGIEAPETSVVLDADLRDRIGSPVTRGDPLLKLSQLEGMYAELRLPESEATRVAVGSTGKIAFESRPEEGFEIRVSEIEPLAIAEESGNSLIVRTEFLGEAPAWWRPGMSGKAKIDCGERSLFYLFTRRAIDYLRMRFWI